MITLTTHCVRRWIERVHPGISADQAAAELRSFLDAGVITEHRPTWSLREVSGGRYVVGPGAALYVVVRRDPAGGWFAASVVASNAWGSRQRPLRRVAPERDPRADRRGARLALLEEWSP